MSTKFLKGISDISDSYAGFILDQWGVLHDGTKAAEHVVEVLKELKGRKKFVIILSNSGKNAEKNKERLKDLGIGPSLYDAIVTSGEMTQRGLQDQSEGFFEGLGKTAYVMSRGGDLSVLDGTGIDAVDDIAKADFLLISGSDAPEKTIEDYEPALKKAAQRSLIALCANPDSRAVVQGGHVMGAGTIARRYKDFGGVVHYIGKPHQPIFQHCIKILQDQDIYPGQTIMVGDAMAHDILGASLVNIDSCLVKAGLHASAFKTVKTADDVTKALNNLSSQYNNVKPTYLVDRFKWGEPLPDRKHKKRSIF